MGAGASLGPMLQNLHHGSKRGPDPSPPLIRYYVYVLSSNLRNLLAFCLVCDETLDVALIIDLSSSINTDEFADLKAFIIAIVEGLSVEPGGTRIGAVSFGTEAALEWQLDEFTTEEDVVDAVNDITKTILQRTNTQAALALARTDLFSGSPGDRADIPNVAIVFTDGVSNEMHNETIPEAELLQDGANATVISIGITNEVDPDEIEGIASNSGTFFLRPNFSDLTPIVNRVRAIVCDVADGI